MFLANVAASLYAVVADVSWPITALAAAVAVVGAFIYGFRRLLCVFDDPK